MDDATDDSVVVVRLWVDPHDPTVRGRILHEHAEPGGDVRRGAESIIEVVADAVHEFERGHADGATEPRRGR